MRVLLTGASSFTGRWFADALADADHEVVMTFQRDLEDYEGLRRRRVDDAAARGRAVFGCSFGDDRFLQLIDEEPGWDVLCCHGAEVTNYKSPAFDAVCALHANTHRLPEVLDRLAERGLRRVVLTGSVFEAGEGAGSEGLPSFSPYGLSKALTAEVFTYYVSTRGMALGKFVIPNPFGPWEEPRFTGYLMRTWREGKRAEVRTPDYVRDNIHVSLLARSYAVFVEGLPDAGLHRINPSGYVSSQGEFALRFAAEMRPRLELACEVELAEQTEWTEPRIRINTDVPDAEALDWNETEAWDRIAQYYEAQALSPTT